MNESIEIGGRGGDYTYITPISDAYSIIILYSGLSAESKIISWIACPGHSGADK